MTHQENHPTFVVGIGASAGGLEAVESLFDLMPVDTGMAFVLIQHLSPDFKSLMDELLARWTDMEISQAEDQTPILPNHIYLMPPKKQMVVAEGCLLLVDKDPEERLTFPIDHFFRSLAQDFGPKAIGIVLSGTGSDGSRGICDIHESGGFVVVQREDTAKFDGMPLSARNTGVADLVLAPHEIPEALTKFAADPKVAGALGAFVDSQGGEVGARERIFHLLRREFDLEFGYYKPTTVNRRIERRMMLLGSGGLQEYCDLLESDAQELEMLRKDLLICVTRFFRDSEAFKSLASTTIEPLVEETEDGDDIRVWVTACATGEEAYTIAILFHEILAVKNKVAQVKVFATDVNRTALEVATLGQYSKDQVGGLSKERLERYFKWNGSHFQIVQEIRQLVVFAPHNLTKDPPFTRINLLTCRNLLIYMEPAIQRKVLSLFHFGLKTGGTLFLGSSETCGVIGEEFDSIDAAWKIYRKSRDGRITDDMRKQFRKVVSLPKREHSLAKTGDDLMLSTYDALLETVMPPALLVSSDGVLVHTFGSAGDFLRKEYGRSSNDFLDKLQQEFQMPVAAILRKSRKEKASATYTGIKSHDGLVYDVTVTPICDAKQKTTNQLIQIIEKVGQTNSAVPDAIDTENISIEQIEALEAELRYSKLNLQATIEELESSNEELQATNEELIASNEELQSTNEELHSVNEELYTVNAEHQNKISQLSELTRDMDNLLESTEVHTIFLDSELAIRKFTPRVAEKFNFLPQDVGRKIYDFTHSIACDGLAEKIRDVIATGRTHQEEVEDRLGAWLLLRILPYRAPGAEIKQASIAGALLTLIDITKLKEASYALEESVRQRDQFLAMLSHELRNPLGTILNATHLLAKSEVDAGTEEAIAVIRRQSHHMAALLADLLDVTRVSQGKIRLKKRPFDLLRTVDNAVETVQSSCDARSQDLKVSVPSESVWIYGSEPRILQVISNLLTNASKYSGYHDSIELSIELDDDEVAIRVRDQGVGIPAEQIDRVFEMFVQSDRTLERADGGLGVGLTLVKSLVELHGGTVSVRSDGEGQGSEFVACLPVCDEPVGLVERKTAPSVTKNPSRIVLVEDNVDASKMLRFLLEDAGYEVAVAHDGKAGFDLIMSEQPDTAVVDVGLPEISGYDLARMAREQPELEHVYLIALTGYGQSGDRAEALESGFDEHLVKPVDPGALSQLIAERNAKNVVTAKSNS